MISSARLGDKHVCPLPGHGTTPIASASADFNINFMGSARVGDTCGCGAVITTGFPSILVNGRPMAHLGSPTSHGGTIITGSGDVGGGFVMGAAPGAAIINFAALGAFRADGTVDDERMATLLADPNLTEKATAANALIHQDAATKQPEAVPEQITQPNVCNDPDRMEELASYIAGEMNRNINDSSVLKMKKLLSFDTAAETRSKMELPWFAQLGATSPQAIAAANAAAAMAIWTERVGQDRPWDHKPIIQQKFGGVRHKQGGYDYFYDIWSNIHYGYVGRAAGLSESVLSDGAGAEQIVSDGIRKLFDWDERRGPQATDGVAGLKAYDDAPDRISIGIGIELFTEHPDGGITAEMIMEKVLAVKPEDWGMAFVFTFASKFRKWPFLVALLLSPLIFLVRRNAARSGVLLQGWEGELRYIWNTQHRIDKGGMLPGEATADLGHIFPNDQFFMEFNWGSRGGRDHCISIVPKWPKTKIYLDSNGNIDSGIGSGTDIDHLKRCTIDDAKP